MTWKFKDWYKENGDDLNDRRRTRYHSDPEYRKRVLKQSKETRDRVRMKKKAEELHGGQEQGSTSPDPNHGSEAVHKANRGAE